MDSGPEGHFWKEYVILKKEVFDMKKSLNGYITIIDLSEKVLTLRYTSINLEYNSSV